MISPFKLFADLVTRDLLGLGAGSPIMKTRLILIFVGIVGTGIIITGYLFNLILG